MNFYNFSSIFSVKTSKNHFIEILFHACTRFESLEFKCLQSSTVYDLQQTDWYYLHRLVGEFLLFTKIHKERYLADEKLLKQFKIWKMTLLLKLHYSNVFFQNKIERERLLQLQLISWFMSSFSVSQHSLYMLSASTPTHCAADYGYLNYSVKSQLNS